MKNKKILVLLVLVLIVILTSLYFIVKKFNASNENVENSISEYTPEEEISSEQLRETIVTLYFIDTNSTLKSEGRLIDSANLLENPYQTIAELLLDGPKTENLFSPFPENTLLLGTSYENNCVTLNFSEDLLNYSDETQKYNIINSLLNSLSQLNEVNSIKILINNVENENFSDEYSLKT